MKLQDKETLNVADAVKDVLEGKKAVKEMDPKKHVSKKGDKFAVVNNKGDVVKSFDSEDEAEKYATDNHDDLMKEYEEPRAKGEKDFKDKHTVKKSGMKDDGSNVKEEVTITIDEAKLKAGKGKTTVDVDFIGDKNDAKAAEKKFKLKIKMGRGTADVTGEKKNIIAWLSSDMYGMDSDDIEDIFPELLEATSKKEGNAFGKAVMAAKEKGDKTFVFAGKKYDVTTKEEIEERSMTPMKDKFGPDKKLLKKAIDLALKMGGNMSGAIKKIEKMQKGLSKNKEVQDALQLANEAKNEEMSAKQKKYQAFFNSALKKFGVKSPAELEGDKKKEFYDYVDANYEADNESD